MKFFTALGFTVLATLHCGEYSVQSGPLMMDGGTPGEDLDSGLMSDGAKDGNANPRTDASAVDLDEERARMQTSRVTTFDGPASDRVYSVLSTAPDNGMLALGYTLSYGGGTAPNAMVFKRDALGAPLWAYHFGTAVTNDQFFGGFETSGALVLGGLSRVSPPGGLDQILVVKLSAAGDWQWGVRFGAADRDELAFSTTSLGSDILVAGRTSPGPGGGLDGYYARLDGATGTPKWRRNLGVAGDDVILQARPVGTDNALLVGYTTGTASMHDAWISKIDGTGAVLWSKVISSAGNDEFNSVLERADGTIVAVGTAEGATLISEFTSAGDHIRSQRIASCNNATVVQQTESGLLIGGFTSGGTADGKTDVFLLKTTRDVSSVAWGQTYGSVGNDQLARGAVTETSDHRILIGAYGSPTDVAAQHTTLALLKANGKHDATCFPAAPRQGLTLSSYAPTVSAFGGASALEPNAAAEVLSATFQAPFTLPAGICPP